ncbi:ferric reductase-like transmembrane domain-containing protein [Ferroacidibacillus organovorans]|uniref:Uncharacterized protein n=1 Tax=Ferroacidibacillus organovorans TaxID=1765683 RepID=A0A117SYE2_9BACL|nr:ferric reductase-like transmembrane domain-containing protein [Ferroacidibacillus organovorans]KUO96815.1 hypothetical protein ATW55_08370 [Ferroacidibacillus organovorans]
MKSLGTVLYTGVLSVLFITLVVFGTHTNTGAYARMTPWLLARAAGITAYVLMTVLVIFGLILSSVPNKEALKGTKYLLPIHRLMSLFLIYFLVIHVVSLLLDAYAHVNLMGAFIPFTAGYRPLYVGIGTLALYATIFMAGTARFTRILPRGKWLTVHRVALVTWILSFLHGVMAGSDSRALTMLYQGSLLAIVAMVILRYVFVSNRRNRDQARARL